MLHFLTLLRTRRITHFRRGNRIGTIPIGNISICIFCSVFSLLSCVDNRGIKGKLSGSKTGTMLKNFKGFSSDGTFTDIDADISEVAGQVVFPKLNISSNAKQLVLYWGNDEREKIAQEPVIELDVSEDDMLADISSNTTIPAGATHFLVYLRDISHQIDGEVSIPVIDRFRPQTNAVSLTHTDTDTGPEEISGDITIVKAIDESNISDYVIYLGLGALTKSSDTPLGSVAKNGSDLVFALPLDVAIGSSTHLLVYTRNDLGECETPVSLAFNDIESPVSEIHKLGAEIMPSNLENNLTIDSEQRTVSVSNVSAGQIISLRIFDDGVNAESLDCSNLPSFGRISSEFLLLDLSFKSTGGTIDLDCLTSSGSFEVSVQYTGSLISIMSANLTGTSGKKAQYPVLSPDGKWLAWRGQLLSSRQNNDKFQILVRNMETMQLFTLSTTDGQTLGDGDSSLPGFSPNSQTIYFLSKATNFGADGTNNQVFRKSLTLKNTAPQAISVLADGVTVGNGSSSRFVIASDESAIYFESMAANLGATGGTILQVIKKSLVNLATPPQVVTVGSDGVTIGTGASNRPALSRDNLFLYFSTQAANLGATGGSINQVVRKSVLNLATSPTVITVTADGSTIGDGESFQFSLSPDESFALIATSAANLGVTGGAIGQIVRKSLINLSTPPVVISTAADGVTLGDGTSGDSGKISSDGSFVLFATSAANLGASLFDSQVIKKSLSNLATAPTVVSVQQDGLTIGDGYFGSQVLSRDNNKVYFEGVFAYDYGERINFDNAIYRKSLDNLALRPEFLSAYSQSAIVEGSGTYQPVISPDQTFLLFSSVSNELGGTSPFKQIVKKSLTDLVAPVQFVSVTSDGSTPGSGAAETPVISPDGTFVLFRTNSTNLTGGANYQIVKKSLVNLQTPPVVVSVATNGTTIGNGNSGNPVISADGSYVLFSSKAANLGATGGVNDQIIKKSLTNLATPPVVVSVTSNGTTIGNGASESPRISSDGSFALFESKAANLGATGGTNTQIIKKNLLNLATAPQVISVTSDGTTIGDGISGDVAISSDSSFTVFRTAAANLGATGGTNTQIVKKSLTNLSTAPVVLTVASDGTTIGNGLSSRVNLSADDSFIVFNSNAANLGATGGSIIQIIKKSIDNLATAPVVLSTAVDGSTLGNMNCDNAKISADGTFVMFESLSSNLGFPSAAGVPQIFHKPIP